MFVVRRSEFGINEGEVGTQANGRVAALDNGNYAIVYSQETLADGISIEVRILDNNGQPILGNGPIAHEIIVSDSATREPVIAPVVGGGFIIAWTQVLYDQNGVISGSEVRAQTFDATGLPVGQLVAIPGASDPAISVSGAGHVLVYQTMVDGDGIPDDQVNGDVPVIRAMTLGTNGAILGTVEIDRGVLDATGQVSENHFEIMSVAPVGTGHAIVWQSHDYDAYGIASFVQLFSGASPIGGEVQLSFFATDVAATGNGNFVVVGTLDNATTNMQDIVGQLLNGSDGTLLGGQFIVNSTTDGQQHGPSVTALNGDGGFVVAWSDEPNDAVGAQAYDPLGQRDGEQIVVTLDGANAFPYFSDPDIAADPYGGFMVTWTGWDASGYGVRGQTYSQIAPTYFFTASAETVDFGALTQAQQQAVNDAVASGQTDSVYNAGDGDDNVVLPDIAEAQVSSGLLWDFDRSFLAGAGNDTVQGGDGGDIINGNAGDDLLRGGAGNDILRGSIGNDQLFGGTGHDLLAESSGDGGPFGNDLYDGGDGNDRVSYFISNGGSVTVDLNLTSAQVTGQGTDTLISIEHISSTYGNDTLTGNSANNWFWTFSGTDFLTGNGGNDYFTVGSGDKTAHGGTGVDTIEIADFAYVPVYTSAGITVSLLLQGTAQAVGTGNWTLTGIENLGGFTGDDELTGDDNANVLAGHIGADILVGGGGDDTLLGDGTFILDANGSQETLEDNTADGPGGNDQLHGGLGNDRLVGGGGNDLLDGGAGADILIGGIGDDTYHYDGTDSMTEAASEGTDTIVSSVTHTLGANFENLTLGGAAAINATGNALDNLLYGNGAANVLNGGLGNDVMVGGAGDDIYYVGEAGDYLVENSGGGIDRIYSSISYSLNANVEELVLSGTGAINATGNGLDNLLYGNVAANILNGGLGNDVMVGGAGDDIYYVGEAGDYLVENSGGGIDRIYSSISYSLNANVEELVLSGTAAINATGNGLDNILYGNAAANILNGALGNDVMVGGLGDDVYYVGEAGDYLVENEGAGTDRVYSSISYSLNANVEQLVLSGTAAINATGNALDNILYGNGAANILNGALGADSMSGGGGDDVYYVDNLGDRVFENAGAGTDRVYSSVSFVLSANVEQLVLSGTAAINATGNALANLIYGNGGANTIDGGLGGDTMVGGAGDDIYYVDDAGDQTVEATAAGNDRVVSSISVSLAANVEELVLGGNAAINGYGNALDNVMTGNAAANTLYGGGGGDRLTGGAGADTFLYASASDSIYATAWDRITDFETGVDLIDLSAIDANSVGGTANDAFTYMGYNVVLTPDANGNAGFATTVAGQLAIMGPEYTGGGGYAIIADLDGNGSIDLRIDLNAAPQLADLLL